LGIIVASVDKPARWSTTFGISGEGARLAVRSFGMSSVIGLTLVCGLKGGQGLKGDRLKGGQA